ncbi:MAG: hypothetical protein JNM24_09415 [Bdellovibrionaceae bacterium]|nr:hypothetical protein [Pseudobdellovibrionaceae bacterium]
MKSSVRDSAATSAGASQSTTSGVSTVGLRGLGAAERVPGTGLKNMIVAEQKNIFLLNIGCRLN